MNKKKKRWGCLITVLILLLIIAGVVLYGYIYVSHEINGQRGDVVSAEVLIEKGSGPLAIGKELKAGGIIQQPQLFRYYVKKMGLASGLQYGVFTFTSDMSYDKILEILMTHEERASTRVTIPEGKSLIQTAQLMEQAGLCTASEFIEVANTGDFSQYTFWSKVQESENAFMRGEGYVFPDTYDFFNDDTVYNMVAKFYANFESKITAEMYARMDALHMSLNDVVILASLIQEEAGNAEDYNVSAVFHNRLAINMMLQSNASSYVQSDLDNNYVWNIMASYYGGWDNIPEAMRTAYDTYKVTGLPAGPISNPGIDAITAALYPTEGSDALFFVTDAAGKYYYARTDAEHEANKKLCGY